MQNILFLQVIKENVQSQNAVLLQMVFRQASSQWGLVGQYLLAANVLHFIQWKHLQIITDLRRNFRK